MIRLLRLISIISITFITIISSSCNKEEKVVCCENDGEHVQNMVIVYVPDSAINVMEIKKGFVVTDNFKANNLFSKYGVWKYERSFPLANGGNKNYWTIKCYDCCECDLGSDFCEQLGFSEDYILNEFLYAD